MSDQTLDLQRSLQIVRRHYIVVLLLAVVGLAGGASYAVLHPPLLSSEAQVVLPPNTSGVATQAVIAGSDPVLAAALRRIGSPMSLSAARDRVTVSAVTSDVLAIDAEGKTATEAEDLANAVAKSYISYVSTGVGTTARVPPRLVNAATTASGESLVSRLLKDGGLGAVAGAFLGALGALALGRGDRRLRGRDDIASAIGIPVLASVPVWHPSDARGWIRLLEAYEPSAIHVWRLSSMVRRLGLNDPALGHAGGSVAVLTLASDRRALALGPHLAASAAASGLRTVLLIATAPNNKATASLRAACVARSSSVSRSDRLRVAVADQGSHDWQQHADLIVVVSVVDDGVPEGVPIPRTDATVLGLSAGAATGEQLARVAGAVSVDGRHIDGILLADPDPDDHTTGRVPELAGPRHRAQPTRVSGMPVRSRR